MKQKIKKLALQLWTDESGQGTLEYALIVVVIVGVAIAFRTKITGVVNDFMDNKVSEQMKNFVK